MTAPHEHPSPTSAPEGRNLLRIAIWVAIGALIAAAIVCVVWVLIGPENDIVGRAFLTILLLAAFAGAAILDTHLAPRRPAWFVLLSMIVWVAILLIGATLIWMPTTPWSFFVGYSRFASFLLIVLILQLAVLHTRLYLKALERNRTAFTTAVAGVTLVLVWVLAGMLVIPLTFNEFVYFEDLYWRFVVAITILAAVGTALLPLLNVLFAPRKPRRERVPAGGLRPWPTYADGVTPLPMLPDGTPDFQAYRTGYPTYPQQAYPGQQLPYPGQQPHAGPQQQAYPAQAQHPAPAAPPAHAPQAAPDAEQPPAPRVPPGYEGYPPPPPPPPAR